MPATQIQSGRVLAGDNTPLVSSSGRSICGNRRLLRRGGCDSSTPAVRHGHDSAFSRAEVLPRIEIGDDAVAFDAHRK